MIKLRPPLSFLSDRPLAPSLEIVQMLTPRLLGEPPSLESAVDLVPGNWILPGVVVSQPSGQ